MYVFSFFKLLEKVTNDQIFKAIKGKPYGDHVIPKVHYVENKPKNQTKDDKKASRR